MPKISQSGPKSSHGCFYLKSFQNSRKRILYIWATIVRYFDTTNFQKTLNLVTLQVAESVSESEAINQSAAGLNFQINKARFCWKGFVIGCSNVVEIYLFCFLQTHPLIFKCIRWPIFLSLSFLLTQFI